MDFQTQSLHYVQIYSVKDRIDFFSFSELPSDGNRSVYDTLPSNGDYQELKQNFAIIVACSITDHLSFFSNDLKNLVPMHIPHPYSQEMSAKSEVVSCYLPFGVIITYVHDVPLLQVPLGVLPKNETKYENMMEILKHLQGYAPAIDVRREMKVPGSNVPLTVDDKEITTTLMGGDQY